MPIFYNFHILLATFYTIFGTNILIQCLVSVPVCCMFFVSQNIHIKRSPNRITTNGDFFGIYMIFGKKNPRETVPEVATRQGRAPDPRGPPVRRLMPFFGRKKANFREKITAKVSIQSELRISIYIRNGEKAEYENAETERDRETDPISEGSRPSHAMGAKDQRGNPSPI